MPPIRRLRTRTTNVLIADPTSRDPGVWFSSGSRTRRSAFPANFPPLDFGAKPAGQPFSCKGTPTRAGSSLVLGDALAEALAISQLHRNRVFFFSGIQSQTSTRHVHYEVEREHHGARKLTGTKTFRPLGTTPNVAVKDVWYLHSRSSKSPRGQVANQGGLSVPRTELTGCFRQRLIVPNRARETIAIRRATGGDGHAHL